MAAGSASIDAVLADAVAKLDGLNKRMDALETKPGSNNPIKGDDDDDDKRDDAKSRTDDDDDKRDDDDDDDKKDDASGGTAPKTKILDDAKGASKTDAAKPPAKVDAKKSDDGELEIRHGKEKDDSTKDDDDDKKDDAFPPKKDDSAKSDDDKKDDSARADAIADLRKQISVQQATIDRLTSLMKPRSDDEHAAFADAQSRADTVFAGFGQRAPRPLDGELLIDYRKRLAKKMKGYSTVWKDSKFARMDDNTFAIAENQIYADATAAAANPMDLAAGELRMVSKIDPQTGVRSNVFYGKESFVKAMGRPGRRVASFRTVSSN